MNAPPFPRCVLSCIVCALIGCGDRETLSSIPASELSAWNGETPVWEVLIALGEKPPKQFSGKDDPAKVQVGRELVFRGKSLDPATGRESPLISHYFVCTDCHNTAREDSDITELNDPGAKLAYAIRQDIPLLQGTTFAGIVNRESWYNDDYAKKYRFSVTVRAARKDLRKATQLCAEACSQGRKLEAWEEDAIMAYYWSLQWKLVDLGMVEEEIDTLRAAVTAESSALRKNAVRLLRSAYAVKSPATFGSVPKDAKVGYGHKGDAAIGREIFERSCLHCHGKSGVSEHYFGESAKDFAKLKRRFGSNSKNGLYALIRVGTHPEGGEKQAYMPNYPKERLSDQQIEDLRSYLESRSK